MIIALILLILFLLIWGIMFVKIRAKLTYEVNFGFVLKIGCITLYSLNDRKKRKIDSKKRTESEDINFDYYSDFLKNNLELIKELIADVFLKFKDNLVFEKILLKYEYGFKDAAVTGVAYGVFSATSNIVLSYLDNKFKVKEIQNEIIPDFKCAKQSLCFKAEFGIRFVHFLKLGTRFLKFLNKLNKGGMENVRTSD